MIKNKATSNLKPRLAPLKSGLSIVPKKGIVSSRQSTKALMLASKYSLTQFLLIFKYGRCSTYIQAQLGDGGFLFSEFPNVLLCGEFFGAYRVLWTRLYRGVGVEVNAQVLLYKEFLRFGKALFRTRHRLFLGMRSTLLLHFFRRPNYFAIARKVSNALGLFFTSSYGGGVHGV